MPISKIKGTGIVDNVELQGTEAARMPIGTTAQRSSAKKGDIRFNDTIDLMEYYDGTIWKAIDSPPVINSISPTTVTEANVNITITGANFQSGASVKFVGVDGTPYPSPSVTVNSTTQIVAQTPNTALTVANEPYDVVVTNPSGLDGTLSDSLDAGGSPSWSTTSPLNEVSGGETFSITLSATDPDGQTVTYSSSDAPTGSSVASNGTFSGTADEVTSDTTKTFTVSASDGVNTTNKTFSIVYARPSILVNGSGQFINTSYSITSQGYYTIEPEQDMTVFMDIWGAGGGGSNNGNNDTRGAAGGEAYGQISLTAGTTYVLIVGQGGRDTFNTRAFPDGGAVTDSAGFSSGSAGGGGSTRFGAYTQSGFNLTNTSSDYNNTNAVYYIIAGAGSGATGYTDGSGGNMGSTNSGPGGYGGGLTGADGDAWYTSGESIDSIGHGGTQSAGGAGGTQGRLGAGSAGAKYSGGNGSGPGGGGGYYGGGGANGYYSIAGGGSGYLNPSFVTNGAFATASHGASNNYISANANSLRPSSTTGYGGLTGQSDGNGHGYDGGFVIISNAYRS